MLGYTEKDYYFLRLTDYVLLLVGEYVELDAKRLFELCFLDFFHS